jgi:hypothetical protein
MTCGSKRKEPSVSDGMPIIDLPLAAEIGKMRFEFARPSAGISPDSSPLPFRKPRVTPADQPTILMGLEPRLLAN